MATWLVLFAFLLSFASFYCIVSAEEDYLYCETVVKNWAESFNESEVRDDKLILRDLLFFLHVPRTGGRTYSHCFLKRLYQSELLCPQSYDKFRFDLRKPKCKVVASHDDYSLTTMLPRERTSVLTILRNPVDRIFSTYEFSVEVAARFLVHPNLSSVQHFSSRVKSKSNSISTLDIWPWKFLVPWMMEDLFSRREARKNGTLVSSEDGNAYDMEIVALPLNKFINDPIAHDIIHNGATFQVAGLTNNSHLDVAHVIRPCVRKHPELGHVVLQVAKNRLDQMLYVGLTEDHEESARLFASMVGAQIISKFGSLKSDTEADSSNGTYIDLPRTETSWDINSQDEDGRSNLQDVEASQEAQLSQDNGNVTVKQLMEAYESCTSSLRKSQSKRRVASLRRIAPVNFSKVARQSVPEAVLNQIILLNNLDIELYNHARSIFLQEHHFIQALDSLKTKQDMSMDERGWRKVVPESFSCSPWMVFVLVVGAILVVLLVRFAVNSRRRVSKIKI